MIARVPDSWHSRLLALYRAIRDGEEAQLEAALERLSRQRRRHAPLALLVGGVGMLFSGLKLLLTNWRLTLIQVLPAIWIWLAMYDLRAHVLHGDSFHALRGPILIPVALAIMAITAASFFLNAVFGFAVAQDGAPRVRPAVAEARRHLPMILGSGAVVGLALALATTLAARAERPWFALSLSLVVGAMMVAYVAVPARLIGVRSSRSRRDRLSASLVGSALGAMVSAPPYLLARIGLLMLGSPLLFLPGLALLVVGVVLQAGATSAVKAMKMSAKLAPDRGVSTESTI